MSYKRIIFLGLILYLKIKYQTDYDKMIFNVSRQCGINGNLVKAIIKIESNFNHRAQLKTERENSRGLMQLNQPTALSLGINKNDLHLLFQPEINIKIY